MELYIEKINRNYKENCYQKGMGEDLHSIKLIPFYRRTYCNKELSTEEEQKGHEFEFEWHI